MKQAIIDKLKNFFSVQPVEKAWVFGSYSLFKYIAMLNALQELLAKKVDLVEEGQLRDFTMESVERDKILIYEREN